LLAVVGAHLTGMPLNGDLVALAAVLDSTTTTSSRYKLFALPNSTPPKPGLLRLGPTDDGGSCIEVEVYRLSAAALGSFMLTVPAPLAIGTVELADGTSVRGFVCEPFGLDGAIDISRHGGWRSYLASTSAQS
jgi:allophanate hydrolase